jgi:SAM-dependent methyltransferase
MFSNYIEIDLRKNRATATVTEESLTKRFEVFLPKWLIKGQRVLDLGSALGAAGHWCLTHGASHYTGVEIQKSFCEKSQNLLSQDWNKSQFDIIESSLDDFIQRTQEQWDVVIAAGILHGFFNPYSAIEKISKLCKNYLVVETLNIPESNQLPTLHICFANMVRDHHTGRPYQGYTSILSPQAFDIVMNENGFVQDGDYLYPRKILHSHDAFNDVMQWPNLPADTLRFGARYKKTDTEKQSLEYHVANDIIKDRAQPAIYEQVEYKKTDSWQFDDTVAERFQQEAVTNIPDYERVIDLCVDVAKQKFDKASMIVDVGSALGHTLDKFSNLDYHNLVGVESSQSMINRSSHKDKIIYSSVFPKTLTPDLVLANWTLHFVVERQQYLQDIYNALNLNGALILTDKTAQVDTIKDLYYNFKRANGISDKYIQEKENLLRGSMFCYSLSWYLETLQKVGFRNCQILNSLFGFVTFYAEK